MKVLYSFLLFLVSTQFITGQKVIRKTIINPENQSIQLDAENCYQVILETSKNRELIVKAEIEGEYQKDLVVKIEEDGSNVLVSTDFLPNFIAPNDKLSAHKVISIALKIIIPEYCVVNVFGTNSKVQATGIYKNLKISLDTGNCVLNNVIESAEVKTQRGTITIVTREGKVDAESIYGIVKLSEIPEGNSRYKLASVEGNIYVKKTE
ncbi:hypothetical protein [uncultured Croceitalea sp.]|uniref:hypothetical protein n=1 Tax=uncultured Croceitalea sp. TaxID=1798908 RepID=UPI00374F6DF3